MPRRNAGARRRADAMAWIGLVIGGAALGASRAEEIQTAPRRRLPQRPKLTIKPRTSSAMSLRSMSRAVFW
jgi:hypothetical protein